jgi:L-ribulose-5-phosphate 4-epimerase
MSTAGADLDRLRARVCEVNLRLVREGLVILTWGNASAVDRERGVVVIKPSGVPYDGMTPAHMVTVSLDTGAVTGGSLTPSSDTATHLALYRAFPGIGGIVHTHSLHATAWAQSGRDLPALGTTHADYFYGPVPCTRQMRPEEIATDYEANTGRVIVERFDGLDPLSVPAVLVASHAPFTWGETIEKAAENALVLEYTARLAAETLALAPGVEEMPRPLLDKHFLRKHGAGAYYGQRGSGEGAAGTGG